MCEKAIGAIEDIKKGRPVYAWKIVNAYSLRIGPFHKTKFNNDGWARAVKPAASFGATHRGYHVFKSKKGADRYNETMNRHKVLKVIKVEVRGKAIPFLRTMFTMSGDVSMHRGMAVASWRPAE